MKILTGLACVISVAFVLYSTFLIVTVDIPPCVGSYCADSGYSGAGDDDVDPFDAGYAGRLDTIKCNLADAGILSVDEGEVDPTATIRKFRIVHDWRCVLGTDHKCLVADSEIDHKLDVAVCDCPGVLDFCHTDIIDRVGLRMQCLNGRDGGVAIGMVHDKYTGQMRSPDGSARLPTAIRVPGIGWTIELPDGGAVITREIKPKVKGK